MFNCLLYSGAETGQPSHVLEDIRTQMKDKGFLVWLPTFKRLLSNCIEHCDTTSAQVYLDHVKATGEPQATCQYAAA